MVWLASTSGYRVTNSSANRVWNVGKFCLLFGAVIPHGSIAHSREGVESSGGVKSFAAADQDSYPDLPFVALCPQFTLKGKLEPALSDTEKKLICGGEGAWKTIPFQQAKFNLTNFLQERGYHHPVFRLVTEPGAGARFTVFAGEATRITSLTATGAPDGPEGLRLERKRKVVGEVLTPKMLGIVEQWVTQRMQAIGYPCPQVKTEANPDTGAVVVQVDRGPLQDLVAIIEEPIAGAHAGILRRYDAFRLGGRFNGDGLTVTENRITQQRILQTAYFTVKCEDRGAIATQAVTAGPPRLLSFGFGFNTEGLLLSRASWRNTRVGNQASLMDVTAQVSTKVQRLTFFSNWYFLEDPSRFYWHPTAEVRHQNENAYNVLQYTGKWLGMRTYDNDWVGLEAGVGTTVDFFRTLRGSGELEPNSYFSSIEAVLRARSHEFEYWRTDPRSGFNAQFTADLAQKGLLSIATAHRFSLDGQALWNLKDYDPALWIFGVRGGYRLTISPERPDLQTRLPASFFRYLGGSQDLRGFARQSVPIQGAMTAAFVDFESRFSTVLPFNVEPFAFLDLGAVGSAPGSLDSPLLYSPGIGLRWKSPVGVLRSTLARGYPVALEGGWTFYFSFGEEF